MRKKGNCCALGSSNPCNMFEGPSYVVPRDLPTSLKQESKQIQCVLKLSNNKRPLEEGEKLAVKRAAIEASKTEEPVKGLSNLSLAQTDQAEAHLQGGNLSDSNSLIPDLGRDITINCLLRCSRSDYGAIASLNRAFRSLIQSGELYRLRREMGIIEHWVYFSCKLKEWEAFDPIHHRWMHLPPMNASDCFMYADKESLAVGTELLVFGKEVHGNAIYRYNLLTNTWSTGITMNTPRCLFGSASLGEIAILAGGCDPRGKLLKSAELYNSITGTWMPISSMHKARKMCSGVFMDGKFYVIGGIGEGSSAMLTDVEMYDLETGKWTQIADMFPARIGSDGVSVISAAGEAPPLLAVVNNELYAADHEKEEVRKFDKGRKLWRTLGRLPEQASSMNGWGLAFRACGDQLIVIGGPRDSGGGIVELNGWVPDEGPPHWKLLARQPMCGFVFNCTVMGC